MQVFCEIFFGKKCKNLTSFFSYAYAKNYWIQRNQITKQRTTFSFFYKSEFSKFCKFSMERKTGLTSITGGCLGGSLTGVLGSENPSSSSMVIGSSTDPFSQEKWVSLTGWATYLESGVSGYFIPLFSNICIDSLSWVFPSYDFCWNPFASPPPCARLGLGCPFVLEKLQTLFLAPGFILDHAKILQSIRLLFFTEKIILSNKLSKRYRVKLKFTVEREKVDGS